VGGETTSVLGGVVFVVDWAGSKMPVRAWVATSLSHSVLLDTPALFKNGRRKAERRFDCGGWIPMST
jgi:hypothetical protein